MQAKQFWVASLHLPSLATVTGKKINLRSVELVALHCRTVNEEQHKDF
jgi:hypothetical protein